MPLNKLENFIKNTEGRVLYVNPNDLDSTDGIDNQGNSLTKPFKTIQRALIELLDSHIFVEMIMT